MKKGLEGLMQAQHKAAEAMYRARGGVDAGAPSDAGRRPAAPGRRHRREVVDEGKGDGVD